MVAVFVIRSSLLHFSLCQPRLPWTLPSPWLSPWLYPCAPRTCSGEDWRCCGNALEARPPVTATGGRLTFHTDDTSATVVIYVCFVLVEPRQRRNHGA